MDKLNTPIWDTAKVVRCATLFSVPVGQGTSVFALNEPKGYADTNMMLSRQIASG
jgi:hypothetical protein